MQNGQEHRAHGKRQMKAIQKLNMEHAKKRLENAKLSSPQRAQQLYLERCKTLKPAEVIDFGGDNDAARTPLYRTFDNWAPALMWYGENQKGPSELKEPNAAELCGNWCNHATVHGSSINTRLSAQHLQVPHKFQQQGSNAH